MSVAWLQIISEKKGEKKPKPLQNVETILCLNSTRKKNNCKK